MALLQFLHAVVAAWLAIYGLNSLLLAAIYVTLRGRKRAQPEMPATWPTVTVQLPIYNEMHVAERLIAAAVALDYPKDRLQIQVLDDSTDETASLAQQAVEHQRRQSVDIQYLRRADRAGFKAGALAEGLVSATGEFLAIFDADFVPQANLLRHLVPYFASPNVGCVQARWEHLNREYSALTETQALGIDGHFVIEQRVRSETGLFLNFNGSAGMWRRACIQDAGGWQSDTLAEDLDLSYRAQLRGWRILFVPDVTAPAELPPQMDALRRQQARWAQGSICVAVKLLPTLLRSDQRWMVKVEAVIHLTGYLVHPLLLLLLLLTIPMAWMNAEFSPMLPLFFGAAVGPPLLYALAQSEKGPSAWRHLRYAPLLVLLGIGLALNNSVAMASAVFGRRAEFQRTPKFDIRNVGDKWQCSGYALQCSPLVWGELLLAVLTLVMSWMQWHIGGSLPTWLVIYGVGFSYVAGTSITQAWQAWRQAGGRVVHLRRLGARLLHAGGRSGGQR